MRILLVDDHPEARLALADFLVQLGHRVDQAADGEAGLAQVRLRRPDLVLSDLRMPGLDGLGLLKGLAALDDPPPVALMTAFGDERTALEAMRGGAIDYLRKPVSVQELHRLVERVAAEAESGPMPDEAVEEADGLVVCGPELRAVVALADRLHRVRELPCLIEGETGSGKELLARRLHHGGRPPGGPFVALNCAAIASGLFEAELFGYAPGSFTGADPRGAEGKLAAATGGTLLLDEVADLPPEQQAKLLRLLEERSFYPVGGNRARRCEARLVCATNADLAARVREGRFREDLFYRLKVGYLRLPPLRERRGDILPLARILMRRVRQRLGRGFQRLSSAAEDLLYTHSWPGNVRHLQHLLEEAAVRFDGAVLDAPHLRELDAGFTDPAANAPVGSASLVLPRVPPSALVLAADGFDLEAWHRALVRAALAAHQDSPVRTAAYLGVSRKVLYTLRRRYGLMDDGPVA